LSGQTRRSPTIALGSLAAMTDLSALADGATGERLPFGSICFEVESALWKPNLHLGATLFASNSQLAVGRPVINLKLPLLLACVTAVTATAAMARSRQHAAPEPYQAGSYFYNPINDPNAVFVGGTYAGSDPDPRIRAALAREFGRRGF
jgi:hypothetical protein